jgi:ATP-binding cassette subfamily C protein LapB
VYLDGVDFTHLSPEYVRHYIAYLPQDVRLFSGSLRDNLTLGLSAPSDEQILSACRLTGLDTVISSHPLGLSLVISEGGLGLSGGQRQLVGVTRMLLAKPRLLFLDEPTASMDSQSEATVVRHLFEEISRDTTLVVVTHKVALLPFVDRIIVMDSGRIVMDGLRDNVLASLKSSAAIAKQSNKH